MTTYEAIRQFLDDQYRRLYFEQFNVEITNEIMIPTERAVDMAGADVNQVCQDFGEFWKWVRWS